MLSKLFLSRKRATPPIPAVPPDVRVYAIGDIHGRLDLLDDLLARIDEDERAREPAKRTTIFLGDLVDRGPDSAGVIDRAIALRAAGGDVRCIMGNHEEIFLRTMDGDDRATRLFCRIGGRETLISYGLDPFDYERLDFADITACATRLVPAHHRAFLEQFEDMIVIGDYAFVHAGVKPGVAFDEQRTAELRWIRDPFLDHRGTLEKMVVHGHTVSSEVEFRPHRIGIDTGAYLSEKLTALMLHGEERIILST